MKKYPQSLFWIGFITNVVGRFFFLFFPALILLFIGIWVKECLIIGLSLLTIDIILSLIEQLRIRKTTLENDNPNFTEFQDAILSPDWRENIKNIVEERIDDDISDE